MASWLMTDWPYRFVTVCKPIRLVSFDLFADMKNIPYWYWRTVYENLYKKDRHPSDKEIVEGIKYLRKSGLPVGPHTVSRILGVRQIFRKSKKSFNYYINRC